jgi:hypothetical protein
MPEDVAVSDALKELRDAARERKIRSVTPEAIKTRGSKVEREATPLLQDITVSDTLEQLHWRDETYFLC